MSQGCQLTFSYPQFGKRGTTQFSKPPLSQIHHHGKCLFDKEDIRKDVKEELIKKRKEKTPNLLFNMVKVRQIDLLTSLVKNTFKMNVKTEEKETSYFGVGVKWSEVNGYKREKGKKEKDGDEIIEEGVVFYDKIKKMMGKETEFIVTKDSFENVE